jgi:uncharacterized membrane protein HdeD (DUF308 family)
MNVTRTIVLLFSRYARTIFVSRTDPPIRTINLVRGLIALAWAALLAAALSSHHQLAPGADVPTFAAALLVAYPLIDVVASVRDARGATGVDARVQTGNAALSAAAVVAALLAVTAGDAKATLEVFGIWALLSGVVQLALAVRRRHALGGQRLMVVSGALSTVAGLSFVAMAGQSPLRLTTLAGYAALGGVLFIASALRSGGTVGLGAPAAARRP